jgi:hypothetical protein
MKPKALAGPHHSVGPGPYGSLPPKVALGLRASVEFGALIRKVVSGRVSAAALARAGAMPQSAKSAVASSVLLKSTGAL